METTASGSKGVFSSTSVSMAAVSSKTGRIATGSPATRLTLSENSRKDPNSRLPSSGATPVPARSKTSQKRSSTSAFSNGNSRGSESSSRRRRSECRAVSSRFLTPWKARA